MFLGYSHVVFVIWRKFLTVLHHAYNNDLLELKFIF